jgi:hypothetical protein
MASNVKVNKITSTSACGTITLGDSGDTISIPSGASLSIGGSVSGIEGIVNWDTTAKTTGFTAVAGNGYFVNTTSGAITVTLPATPTAGDLVAVKDYALTAQTNNITLGRNGSNIQGVANDFIINTQGRSVTLIYVDGTQGWMLTGASQASDIEGPLFVTATGGTVTCCGDYKIHTFNSPGTFTVTCAGNTGGSNTIDYLVVAGGGGGGFAGGGGAGGYRTISCSPVSATGYPVTVGGGGGGYVYTTPQPSSGSPSVFSSTTSAGGGNAGAATSTVASSGGSGGGGVGTSYMGAPSIPVYNPGAAGNTPPVSPPQGNNGGTGGTTGGGGGGGASAVGNNGSGGTGGTGGAGTTYPITATAYAGGGGGGGDGSGAGGTGGGGAGATGNCSATSGTANTGGGGGGVRILSGIPGTASGNGGSGVVVIRYKYQ